jgi:hypothetical protein
MGKTVVSATATIPAVSTARSLLIAGRPVPATAPAAPAPQATVKPDTGVPLTSLPPVRYAAAVLEGQPDMLESIAPCFIEDSARIRKHEEGWILESSDFESCTNGEQVFGIADDIVSRIHRILALYCGMTATLSVGHIYWINTAGEKLRTIRGSMPVNVVSSQGLAGLKTMHGPQPLGSVVFNAMTLDVAVGEALALHGEGGLGWSQVYDIIEFLGGETGVVKAGYATRKKTRTVRQTANHFRHLGSQNNFPLPSNPPTLAEATEFARSVLRRFVSLRL